jgi:hypothetical protein
VTRASHVGDAHGRGLLRRALATAQRERAQRDLGAGRPGSRGARPSHRCEGVGEVGVLAVEHLPEGVGEGVAGRQARSSG